MAWKITGVSILSILLSFSTLEAQSTFDGSNWNGWSSSLRMMYLVGWVDGRAKGLYEATTASEPYSADKVFFVGIAIRSLHTIVVDIR